MIDPKVEQLRSIRDFDALIEYLRDELDWPITPDMAAPDLVFDYSAEELGLDEESAVKIERIVRLRPLVPDQPWGIFFIEFFPGRLPITVLRRVLRRLVETKRASKDRQTWEMDDLLFISRLGEEEDRGINLAHFTEDADWGGKGALRVVDWDEEDSHFHMLRTRDELRKLAWPDSTDDHDGWREKWSSAFALVPGEVVRTSKQLAVEMARRARLIRGRVNDAMAVESDKGPLRKMFKAFQEVLLHDLTEDDFADMYAQTMTYGLFAARRSRPMGITFDNAADMVPATNPFLRDLLSQFTEVGGLTKSLDFDELGIDALVEMLNLANMEAIVADFDDKNPQEDPVLHFYELFLKEYDPKKRLQRGIFFTPRPVVSFIVRSVHRLLQTEFGLRDGLADTTTWGEMAKRHGDLAIPEGISPDTPFVQILDPAVGTGTFLVEVINIVHETMLKKWDQEGNRPLLEDVGRMWNEYVADHLLPRLYGYEIMMAPYAIAHMKIGLKLEETGYRTAKGGRLGIYLTNSLEPAHKYKGQFEATVPALAQEASAVGAVKQNSRFTVVIGNPPYSGISANRSRDEKGKLTFIGDLIEQYRQIDGAPLRERNPKMLQDDYVKFIRLGEWLVSQAGIGVWGYITNHAYLDNPTFRGMRESLLRSFDKMWVLNLHGSSRRQERSPSGGRDENVFDIQQGVAITLGLASGDDTLGEALYEDVWGTRQDKADHLAWIELASADFETLEPSSPFYLLTPHDTTLSGEFEMGTPIPEVFPVGSVGIDTGRDSLTIQWERPSLEHVLRDFSTSSPDEARSKFGLGKDTVEWKVTQAQADLRRTQLAAENYRRILYRAFDSRFTYYTGKKGFHSRPRYGVMKHMLTTANIALVTVRQQSQDGMPWAHVGVADSIAERCYISNKTKEANYYFPLFLSDDSTQRTLSSASLRRPNLGAGFLEVLCDTLALESTEPFGLPNGVTPEDIFNYIYAEFHSPTYRSRYADYLRLDFPRLLLTQNEELFRVLSGLGDELVALHVLESPKVDECITEFIGAPGSHIVEKVSWASDTIWLDNARSAGFTGVSEEVWNFHIGGYQVCEKWLKDRQPKGGKFPRPGRVLTKVDVEHYQKIIGAISETIRIMGEIDEVIEAHGGWPGAFVTAGRRTSNGGEQVRRT